MPSSGEPPRIAVVVDLLERMLEDRSQGRIRELREYQLLYPGYESEVAREYGQVIEVQSTRTGDRTGHVVSGTRRIRYGKYETAREIGSGGQGVVYLARHVRLDKDVALKVLAQARMTEADKLRFEREARLAAQIDHPGLCPVFDFGFEEGDAFLAMQFVPGVTLATQVEDQRSMAAQESPQATRSRIRNAVELIERVARALHVAHEAGIVHRDVKPSNIMVRPDGSPVVLDFGIARRMDPDRSNDRRQGREPVFGTPPYMAPEQFAPDIVPDRRADVFALGAVLYELVTLQRAFPGPLQRGSDGQLTRSTPLDPHRLVRHVDRDLSLVISTALARERADRYLTALDLAEDLRAILEARPIRAVPPSLPHRLHRWTQRNPRLAASVAALFLTLAVGLVVSLVLLGEAESAREGTERENYRTRIRAAQLSLDGGDTASAREELDACPERFRGAEWHHLRYLTDSSEFELPLDGVVGEVLRFPSSPRRFGVLVDESVRTFDLGDERVSSGPLGAGVSEVLALAGDRILVEESSGNGYQLRVRDSAFEPVTDPIPLDGPTSALAASTGGSTVAYSDEPGEIVVVRGDRSDTSTWLAREDDALITHLQLSPGGERLAAAFPDDFQHSLIVFDTSDLSEFRWIREEGTLVKALSFSSDGLRLVVASADNETPGSDVVSVWDLVSGNCRRLTYFHEHIGSVTALVVHPEGDVFVGTEEGSIHWLSSDLQHRRDIFRGHVGRIESMVLDGDGQWLITSSADRSVRTWSTRRPVGSYLLDPTDRPSSGFPVTSVAFDASGHMLVAGDPAGDIDLWDLDSVTSQRHPVDDATTVGFARGGTVLAAIGFGDQDFMLQTVSLNSEYQTPLLSPDLIRGKGPILIDSPRSRIVFARDPHAWVRVMAFDDPSNRSRELEGPRNPPKFLAISHDGNRIAAAAEDELHVWDLADGEQWTFPNSVRLPDQPYTRALALDTGGRWLALAGGDTGVLLYDLDSGSHVPRILPHFERVRAVAFSPTEERLATLTADGQVHLWDYLHGADLLSMSGVTDLGNTLAFSDQGDRLAAGLIEGRVHVWELGRGGPSGERRTSGIEQSSRPWQVPLADRLRMLTNSRSSILYSRQDAEVIIRCPFYPREWYELAHKALPRNTTRSYTPFLNEGLALLRLGDPDRAEEQLTRAVDLAFEQLGVHIWRNVAPLIQALILQDRQEEAEQRLLQYRVTPEESGIFWETSSLRAGPDAVAAYRRLQEITLRTSTPEDARAELTRSEDLPDGVRTAANQMLDHSVESPALYHVFAWLFTMDPGRNEEHLVKAEAWARRAVELQETIRHRLTLTAVLYRSG